MTRPRVLVIDDDAGNQTLFHALLSHAGCDVVAAADGKSGLEMLKKSRYEAIILDLMMPRVGGREVLSALAAMNPSLLKKVIIATGASRRMLDQVDATAVHALIRKPFDIEELIGSVLSCTSGNG